MSRVLLDRRIRTAYGQLELILDTDSIGFEGDMKRTFAGQANGLVGAADSSYVYLPLAGWSGGHVRVVLLDDMPPIGDSWEDIVEVSITVTKSSSPRLVTWAAGSEEPLELGCGAFRLRVNARDRDKGHQDENSGTYLLELWPAPTAPDAVLKVTSENGLYWQRQNGQRAHSGRSTPQV